MKEPTNPAEITEHDRLLNTYAGRIGPDGTVVPWTGGLIRGYGVPKPKRQRRIVEANQRSAAQAPYRTPMASRALP